jgi:pimeloyl-ACP methyl ester carboxylesterase
LFVDYTGIPQLNFFSARDGKQLPYRYYPTRISGSSNKILILVHGSGWHSRYFYPLAKYLSSQNLAEVYTPDLRGHGYTPERLVTSFGSSNYQRDLAAKNKPLLVVAGTADEVNYADKFKPVILQYTKAQVELLPGVTHMGVVVGPEVRPVIGFEKLLQHVKRYTLKMKKLYLEWRLPATIGWLYTPVSSLRVILFM